MYFTIKIILTTKKVKLIKKKLFVTIALDLKNNTCIIYVINFDIPKSLIHFF